MAKPRNKQPPKAPVPVQTESTAAEGEEEEAPVIPSQTTTIEGIYPLTHVYHRMTWRRDGKVLIERPPFTSLIRDRLTGKLEGQDVRNEDLYTTWKQSSWLWETIKNNPLSKQHV